MDTNIIIRLVEYADPDVQAFLNRLERDDGIMVTSELTLAEILVHPIENDNRKLIAFYEDFLSTSDGVEIVPVDRIVLRQSAAIRARFKTKTADSIHVASALEWGCTYLVTADERLRGPPEIPIIYVADLPEWRNAR